MVKPVSFRRPTRLVRSIRQAPEFANLRALLQIMRVKNVTRRVCEPCLASQPEIQLQHSFAVTPHQWNLIDHVAIDLLDLLRGVRCVHFVDAVEGSVQSKCYSLSRSTKRWLDRLQLLDILELLKMSCKQQLKQDELAIALTTRM